MAWQFQSISGPQIRGPSILPQTLISLCTDPKLRRYPEHRKSIKKHLPWWDLVETDHLQGRGLVETHFPQYLDFYDSLPYPEQKINLLRYMHLYIYGGLCLDSELALRRSPEELFSGGADLFLLPTRWDLGYYSTCLIGSRAEHPLWSALLKECRRRCRKAQPWKLSRQAWVSYTTGSHLLTSVLKASSHPVMVLSRSACLGEEGPLYRLEERCWDDIYRLLMIVVVVIVIVMVVLLLWVTMSSPSRVSTRACEDPKQILETS